MVLNHADSADEPATATQRQGGCRLYSRLAKEGAAHLIEQFAALPAMQTGMAAGYAEAQGHQMSLNGERPN